MVPTVYSVTAAWAAIERPGSADTRAVMPAVTARGHDGGAPLGDRRGLLALDVGDAQAATDRQLGQIELAHPRCDDLDGLVEEVGHEHLAADVHVDADQLDGR